MSLVNVYTEWDPLEEVIVGRALHAQIARPDSGLFAVEYQSFGSPQQIPSGKYSRQVIEETEEDLEDLISTFEKLGIIVRRPEPFDHARSYRTPDWETDGQYNYCPRDLFVAIDHWLIESPMTLRCRQYETLSFKPLLLEYLKSGSRWVSAPKPRLLDEAYSIGNGHPFALTEVEPVFDAANLLRLGEDILYLVSDSGNRIGAHWLQTLLGPDYRVRTYDNVYSGTHIDTTITPVRPGLVVVNGERVGQRNLPDVFEGWDVISLPQIVDIGYTGTAYSSPWIGMNFLMVRPDLAIVDPVQTLLVSELERRGVSVIPLRLRHARTLGGGFHCVTLDVRRRGTRENYCRPPRMDSLQYSQHG